MFTRIKTDEETSTIKYVSQLEIKRFFRLNLSVQKRVGWNEYLQSIGVDKTLKQVINIICNNLICTKSNGEVVILVNPNYRINNFTLDELARLINKGNLVIKGTNIFRDSFEDIKERYEINVS